MNPFDRLQIIEDQRRADYDASPEGVAARQAANAQAFIGTLAAGLVAVPDRAGGFHIYMTGGCHDPRKWLRGELDGASWYASRADLDDGARCAGRMARPVRDYLALAVV